MEQEEGEVSSSGEADIFEITDFTNATPWESFIADLEGLFRQWELARPDYEQSLSGGIQHRKTERIGYSSRKFVVTLEVEGGQREKGLRKDTTGAEWPEALHQMMDTSQDFPPRAHHLARWYGLSQFVVICPTEGAESLHSQAQANLMLSSVSIAITNTGCATPVFVQLHQPWRLVYVGMCGNDRMRLNFSMTHLRHTPAQVNHLSGLLNVFKSKIGTVASMKMEPVQVAVRFLYVLRHWSLDDWPVEPLADVDKGFDGEYLGGLRVGAFTDPVKELHLSAIWPRLTEELVTDTGTHSDLNPTHASVWTVSLHLTENASCILAETLLNFYQLCFRNGSVAEMLGKTSLCDEESFGVPAESFSKPLDRLTAPGSTLASPLFQSVVYTATQRVESGRSPEENITERDLDAVVKFLFPDAFDSNQSTPSPTTRGDSDLVVKLKSAPLDSLTCRLAKALAIVNTECGVKAMCKVWHEVTLELRYRWENGISLPHISEGPPDMKCCILHQKLQMLNCSILHKIKHQQQHSRAQPIANHVAPYSSNLSSSAPETRQQSSLSQPTPRNSATTTIGTGREGERACPQPDGAVPISDSGTSLRLRPEEERRQGSSEDGSEDEFFEALEDHDQVEEEGEGEGGEEEEAVTGASSQEAERGEGGRGGEREMGGKGEVGGEKKREKRERGKGERKEQQTSDETVSGAAGGDEGERGSGGEDVAGERGGGEGKGRQELCGDLVLIATGEPMYIPITQEHPPLTEVHVWEQQAVMAKLGTSEEATRLRAKMQSSSLMSDMQAFKAANPGCLLEDFVRWYSPRDWEEGEEEGEEGKVGEGEEKVGEGEGKVGEGEGEVEEMEVGEGEGEGEEKKVASKFEVEEMEKGEGEGWGEEGWGEEEGGGEWDVIGGESTNKAQETSGGESENFRKDQQDKDSSNEEAPTRIKKKFVSGRLSLRMRQPGGLWREVWSVAGPVPAHRQKKLFDDTREAEKVLHYLAGLKTAELGLLVLPILTHCAVHTLRERHAAHRLSSSESHLTDAVSLLSSIPHPTTDSLPKFREVISLLSQTEHLQAAGHSLRLKLATGLDLSGHHGASEGGRGQANSEIAASVEVLLQEPELVLQDPTASRTGLALQGLLAAQVATRDLEEQEISWRKIKVSSDMFPPPSGREYILRSTLPRPSPHSLPTPQRMYCVLTPSEFRLAGAFSSDILIT